MPQKNQNIKISIGSQVSGVILIVYFHFNSILVCFPSAARSLHRNNLTEPICTHTVTPRTFLSLIKPFKSLW